MVDRSPFAGLRVLVVGDLILDEYLVGRATRLSREAAVPVLERTRRQLLPGGAANPAVGVVALGARATVVGVVGEDAGAAALHAQLESRGVATDGICPDTSRPTTTKTRIVAEGGFVVGQQLARIDHLSRAPLAPPVEQAVLEQVARLAPTHDVLLLSDYKGGVVTPSLLDALRDTRTGGGPPLVVDSQGELHRFEGFALVKCNRAEAERFIGTTIPPDDEAARRAALRTIHERTGAARVVVTLGGEGMAWLDDAQGYGETHAARADVYDVTGAGDTVIALLALAVGAGWPLARGCRWATVAAARTVRVMGNHTPRWDEVATEGTEEFP